MSKIRVFESSDTKIINIEIFIVALISMWAIHTFAQIHMAISLVLGIVIGILTYIVFMTRIGFWIITILFSSLWAIIIGSFTYSATNEDPIWGIVIGIISFIASIGLHSLAKRYEENVSHVD